MHFLTDKVIQCFVLLTDYFFKKRNESVIKFFNTLDKTAKLPEGHPPKHKIHLQPGEMTKFPGFPDFFQFSCEIAVDLFLYHSEKRQNYQSWQRTPNDKKYNKASIITTILKPGSNDIQLACLTGDTELKRRAKLNPKNSKVFQVPHHGSGYNCKLSFYKKIASYQCTYLISCGTRHYAKSKTPFPHKNVIPNICNAYLNLPKKATTRSEDQNKKIRIILTSIIVTWITQ